MKTFGELKIGDTVYSLNYDEWGVLTKHTITDIKNNGFSSVIIIKGYLRHQIIGDPDGPKSDLKLFVINKSSIGEIAPSIEGVKKHWIMETEDRIKRIESEIEEKQKFLQKEYMSLEKIKNINN